MYYDLHLNLAIGPSLHINLFAFLFISDIQPPVVAGCPTNRYILTSDMTSKQTWSEPTITDPLGQEVQVTQNYQKSSFDFPWGEYTIQYSAVKPSNGLRAECTFNVSVKRKLAINITYCYV